MSDVAKKKKGTDTHLTATATERRQKAEGKKLSLLRKRQETPGSRKGLDREAEEARRGAGGCGGYRHVTPPVSS